MKHAHYKPIADWTGNLILPSRRERRGDGGVYFEIQNTPPGYKKFRGKKAWLTFHAKGAAQKWINMETRDIVFTEDTYKSKERNIPHPDRLNGWQNVTPLETIAGGRPAGDVQVSLKNVEVVSSHEPLLNTTTEPVQIRGSQKALVQFAGQMDNETRQIDVRHYNPESGRFDGPAETLDVAQSWFREDIGRPQVTLEGIHESPLNQEGWYVFGDSEPGGKFTVKALEPRSLLRVETPADYHAGLSETLGFIDDENWEDCRKGNYRTSLLDPSGLLDARDETADLGGKVTQLFTEGLTCFLIHVFGWISVPNPNPIERMGIMLGHFAFGIATVVRDPFTRELRWDIEYKQVYAHTVEGIISGSQKWHAYMGSLKLGWMNLTPVSDIIVYHPGLCFEYRFDHLSFNPFDKIENNLHRIMARVRSGTGTGRTFVNMATSCVQDAALAIYVALRETRKTVFQDKKIREWLKRHPDSEQTRRFTALKKLMTDWEHYLKPYKILPARWFLHEMKVDFKLPLPNLTQFADAFLTKKTILPRIAHDGIAKVMAENNALLWIIRTDQIGGTFEGNDPLWPTTFDKKHPSYPLR